MKVAVVGNGKIGSAIYKSLKSHGFETEVADCVGGDGVTEIDVSNHGKLADWLSKFKAVLCATPYSVVLPVARAAAEAGVAYFDLTEDVQTTKSVKSLKSSSVLVPQCGLAPGAISIIAANLVKKFDKVESIDIRVGALPLYPNNSIQYYLTWSTDGLVNEYCNLCEVLHDGQKMNVKPLEGLEQITIDGCQYEAFNTSGGVGSLCETYYGWVQDLTYKTIRYPGHCGLMRFLVNDLNLSKNRDLFIKLFDQEVPQTRQDVVIVFVKVFGRQGVKLLEETYCKKVYGDDELSAIQRTTMSGICGAFASWALTDWPKKNGFVRQEDIAWKSFTGNQWGELYEP